MWVTVYHNRQSRFEPYLDGQQLVAVATHWLDTYVTGPAPTPVTVADWAYHTFNADLHMLEAHRGNPAGETAFLAACVYRLLGYRSLSVGDVAEVHIGPNVYWQACDPAGWRRINPPANRTEPAPTTQDVYHHLAHLRDGR